MTRVRPGMVAVLLVAVASCSSIGQSSRADDIADSSPVNWSPAEADVTGTQLTLHFVDAVPYDATNPCSARFTAAVTERPTEVHVKVTRWRPRPRVAANNTGCFLIGYEHTLRVTLDQPLQDRRLIRDT